MLGAYLGMTVFDERVRKRRLPASHGEHVVFNA